jgi:hypothetical protein
MSFPTARISERRFVLLHHESACYQRDGRQPARIIGFTLEVMLRENPAKPHRYVLSACADEWQPVERRYYHDFIRPLRDAEMAGIVQHGDWKFTQPDRGCKLYSKPRTKIDLKHRRVKKDLAKYLQERSLAMLTTPESLFWISRFGEEPLDNASA